MPYGLPDLISLLGAPISQQLGGPSTPSLGDTFGGSFLTQGPISQQLAPTPLSESITGMRGGEQDEAMAKQMAQLRVAAGLASMGSIAAGLGGSQNRGLSEAIGNIARQHLARIETMKSRATGESRYQQEAEAKERARQEGYAHEREMFGTKLGGQKELFDIESGFKAGESAKGRAQATELANIRETGATGRTRETERGKATRQGITELGMGTRQKEKIESLENISESRLTSAEGRSAMEQMVRMAIEEERRESEGLDRELKKWGIELKAGDLGNPFLKPRRGQGVNPRNKLLGETGGAF